MIIVKILYGAVVYGPRLRPTPYSLCWPANFRSGRHLDNSLRVHSPPELQFNLLRSSFRHEVILKKEKH